MKKIYLLSALFIFINLCVSAQWQQSNGPYGGNTLCLVENNGGLFTGDFITGIYFSSDHGANWVQRNNGISSPTIECLETIGNAVYAGTWNGLYVSYNDGLNWTRLLNGLPGTQCHVNVLAFDGTNFIANSIWQGLFISPDSGLSWQPFSIDPSVSSVSSIKSLDGKLFACTDQGLFVSIDHGNTWTILYSGSTVSVTGIYPSIVIQTTVGVYFSSDGGANWISIVLTFACPTANYFALYNGNIVSESQDVFYLSTDSGRTFTPLSFGNIQTNSIYTSGTDIYLATINGIYRSTDGGYSFVESNKGIKDATANALYAEDTFVLSSTYGGIYRSTDNGINWTLMNSQIRAECFEKYNGVIYAGTTFKGVFVSLDNGLTWTPKNTGLGQSSVSSFAFIGNEIFANSFQGIFKSINGGSSWTTINNPIGASYINFIEEIDSILLVGTTAGIARSADHGNSWYWTLNAFVNAYDNSICKIDSTVFVNSEDSIFVSLDKGLTWSPLTLPQSNLHIKKIFADGNNLIVSADFFGIYMSPDKGTSWVSYNFGTISRATNTFASNSTTIFTSGQQQNFGVWALNKTYAGIPDSQALPDQLNVFPNPFSNELNISYSLKSNTKVTVEIFNVQGKRIEVLNENSPKTAGTHALRWRNSNPGIYFVRIQTDSEMFIRKLICQ